MGIYISKPYFHHSMLPYQVIRLKNNYRGHWPISKWDFFNQTTCTSIVLLSLCDISAAFSYNSENIKIQWNQGQLWHINEWNPLHQTTIHLFRDYGLLIWIDTLFSITDTVIMVINPGKTLQHLEVTFPRGKEMNSRESPQETPFLRYK